jgi:hypothetical protein
MGRPNKWPMRAIKGVFGSLGALSHLVYAEYSYVDYIQMCFYSMCLVGPVRRAVFS